jgi:methionyl-tRNA formyltransferase
MEYFVKNNANIVGILESPTEGITTTTSGGSSSKAIHVIAEEQSIPIICGKPKDEGVMDQLREWAPDMIVVIGYQFFLPDEFLNIPPMIAYKSYVDLEDGDTVDTLYDRIWKNDEGMVKQLLDDIDNDSVPRTPQDKSEYTYNYVPHEKDFEFDFRQPAQLLVNRHLVKPYKSYVILNGTQYPVYECTAIDEPTTSRNFKLNTPYECNGNLVYMTPNKWLQIDQLTVDGDHHSGLELAQKEIDKLTKIGK